MEFSARDKRKYAIIRALINSEKAGLIEKLEALLASEGIAITENDGFKPMLEDEFKAGIEQALDDYKNARYSTHKEFGEMIKGWSTE